MDRGLRAFISREQPEQPEGTYGFLLITEEGAWILVLNLFQIPSIYEAQAIFIF